MGLLDNIGKTISDAGQGAIQKGKEMADIAKYNSLISEEGRKQNSIFEQLGRKYLEVKGDSPDDAFKEFVAELKASEERVKEYQQKLVELRGVTKCPSCGAAIPSGSNFCTSCGKAMNEQGE